jgi:hypothetical protein
MNFTHTTDLLIFLFSQFTAKLTTAHLNIRLLLVIFIIFAVSHKKKVSQSLQVGASGFGRRLASYDVQILPPHGDAYFELNAALRGLTI